MRPMRLIATALLGLTVLPDVTRAQDRLTQPDSVPAALAAALITSSGFTPGSDPLILVGAVPDWAAQRVPAPAGWRVVGSAFMGTIVIGVLDAPTAPDSSIRRFEQTLLAAGWKPTPPPNQGFSFGGFRPAQMMPMAAYTSPTRRFTLCRDNQTVSAWISKDRALTSTIVFRLANAGMPSICTPTPRDTMQERMMRDRPQFPVLYDPESPRDPNVMRECYNVGSGMTSTQTRVKTTMAGDKVLDHYARQLRDSGWTAGGPTSLTSVKSWSRADSTGKPIHVVLTVVTSLKDSTCKSVSMEVQRPQQ